MSKYSFPMLLEFIQTHPMPEKYDIYYVFGLLRNYEIPFRLLNATTKDKNVDSPGAYLPLFEVNDEKWILTSSSWATPGLFDLKQYNENIKSYSEDSLTDKLENPITSISEEGISEYNFYDTLSQSMLVNHVDYVAWRTEFEREANIKLEKEALLEALPVNPTLKPLPRL